MLSMLFTVSPKIIPSLALLVCKLSSTNYGKRLLTKGLNDETEARVSFID